MISISSLAQRFRPRPAVLPPNPAIIPLMGSQQQQTQTTGHHHQLMKHSSLEASMHSFSLAPHASGGRIGQNANSDTSNLVSDPVLGSSNSRLASQETAFGSLPIHVLTPIVSHLCNFIKYENSLGLFYNDVPAYYQIRGPTQLFFIIIFFL